MTRQDVLRSEFDLAFTYTRTYGPLLSQFFTALRDKRLLGIKTQAGKILCPPQEYDPDTGEDLCELVELSTTGRLQSWCWVDKASDKDLLATPFAWGLIRMDGADSCMLHVIKVQQQSELYVDAPLRIVWRQETQGEIRDIAYFEAVSS